MDAVAQVAVLRPLIVFAHTHDDFKWFRLWFSVATVIASIVFNLGIFALLVSLHMGLDIVKYRTKHELPWHWTVVESLRESLVDIFFIVLGLLLALMFHHTVAIGGLGRLAEVEVLFLSLVLRMGPRMKIAEHILEIVLYYKHHFSEQFAPRTPLSRGEQYLLMATLLCTGTILLAPALTSLTLSDVSSIIRHEVTPRLELSIMQTVNALGTP